MKSEFDEIWWACSSWPTDFEKVGGQPYPPPKGAWQAFKSAYYMNFIK